jgi:hypothetical protein
MRRTWHMEILVIFSIDMRILIDRIVCPAVVMALLAWRRISIPKT